MPASLVQQTMKLSHSPYQAMYGELDWSFNTTGKTSYKGDYSAKFVVENINIISAENLSAANDQVLPLPHSVLNQTGTLNWVKTKLTFQPMGEEPDHHVKGSEFHQPRHYQFKGRSTYSCTSNLF